MKIYKNTNVFEEALNRIRFIFDEFPNVIVSVSGGKDSTVIFNLSMMVAKEKGRLPLKVAFIDQEAEWKATIDQIKLIMYNKDVEPRWYQIPFRIFNATSKTDHWLKCWDPEHEDEWMRPKDPIAIKENIYGTDRFKALFGEILRVEYPNEPAAYIGGVRTEESPRRFMGLTQGVTYKWVTWGKIHDRKRNHYTFYPIYDWSYIDVWKAIHENGWSYNKIYDYQFAHGVPIQNMRVSNLHHETAVNNLFYLQEVEPDTYEKLTQRIKGIDMAGKLGQKDYFVHKLPFMFTSWKEYRDYLLEHLLENDKWKNHFRKEFNRVDKRWGKLWGDDLYKAEVQSILTNDFEFTKLYNFIRRFRRYEHARRSPS